MSTGGPSDSELNNQATRQSVENSRIRTANRSFLTKSGDTLGGLDSRALANINFADLNNPNAVGISNGITTQDGRLIDEHLSNPDNTDLINRIIATRNTILQARAQPGRAGTIFANPKQTTSGGTA